MRRVLHLVRSEHAALPADAVADSDMVVYTRMPPCPAAASWFLWRSELTHDQAAIADSRVIDSLTLCELVFQADTVVVW